MGCGALERGGEGARTMNVQEITADVPSYRGLWGENKTWYHIKSGAVAIQQPFPIISAEEHTLML